MHVSWYNYGSKVVCYREITFRWKSCEIQVLGVGQGQNFYDDNSGEFGADSWESLMHSLFNLWLKMYFGLKNELTISNLEDLLLRTTIGANFGSGLSSQVEHSSRND